MVDFALRQVLRLAEPVGITWLFLIIITFALFRKRQRFLGCLSGFLMLLIFAVGSTDLPGAILRSLERLYAGVNLAELPNADAVVMLGGGIEPARFEAGGFHLTRAGDRVLMAVEMMRRGKAPTLVLGGAGAPV